MDSCLLTLFALVSSVHSLFALPSQDACLLPQYKGPCRAKIARFYYNTLTQECEGFNYGGCQGNGNNFESYPECRKTCFRIPKIPQICRLPQKVGPCRALLLRYSFNMTTMQCQPFHYGGCQGNNNNFYDVTSCKEYCSPQKTIPVLCFDPLDKGRCAASIQRYYYNTATKKCEEFIYTGCGGNSNNFASNESCMEVCVKGRKKSISSGKIRQKKRDRKNSIVFMKA
ncbi:tissue factor pathway inhibitor 2 [Lampris incognitus]|uniref:tissue factor pathway inhibitor 2 n=1 Tax=Lampris incognitus TaxID=2546036 RepID=UPI0024B548C2|nr:tissue factor pathway inhibitor 2 [Lampris incognitus]